MQIELEPQAQTEWIKAKKMANKRTGKTCQNETQPIVPLSNAVACARIPIDNDVLRLIELPELPRHRIDASFPYQMNRKLGEL